MNTMIDDETLDRQLREAAPYIDDDGFTARVMARLPAARREPRWLRAMILLGMTLLGSGVVYLLPGVAVAYIRVWLRFGGWRLCYHFCPP